MPDKEEHGSQKRVYLTVERKYIYLLFMIAFGMMGAYTFNLRGGVFCNAQTANVVLMSLALGKGEWLSGLYYCIPITAYISGAFVSEFFPSFVKRLGLLRWDTCLIGFEIIVLFVVGWIPLTVNPHVVQVIINFIASMHYNTFRQAEDMPMSATFCTNHCRVIGICISKYIRHKDRKALRRGIFSIVMILVFLAAGVLLTFCCGFFAEKVIWLALIPLIITFIALAHADITVEHARLSEKPLGH